jgi:predicted alpha-1,2-mannosidase
MFAYFLLGFLLAFVSCGNALEACEQVNSFIATGGLAYGYGGINPGAQYPFGPLRLGPDTTYYLVDISYRHFSGYHYQDKTIRAFSHTHLVGGGVNDLGSIGVMPISAEAKNLKNTTHNSWWSDFNKSTESASPGFYSVYLDGPKVQSEMMAISTTAAVHRYTWDSNETKPAIVIDMCHDSQGEYGSDNRCLEGSMTVDSANPNVFTGHQHTKDGLSGDLTVFIYAELVPSAPNQNHGVDKWTLCTKTADDSHLPDCSDEITTLTAAHKAYGIASFGRSLVSKVAPFTVELRIGISFISVDQAKANLAEALSETTNYNRLATRTKKTWCDLLSYASVTPYENDPDFATIFYSAMYRAYMSPTDYTEAGGVALEVDKKVHNVQEERSQHYPAHSRSTYQYKFFSDFSLWDTFRSLHPWLFLVNEDLAIALARSMEEITIQQTAFPRWVLGSHESACMVGEHGAAFMVELIRAGLGKEVNMTAIQSIFLHQETTNGANLGRTDLDRWMTEGYVSQDVSGDAAVETLTYAFDDYLLGQISDFVGDSTSAQQAMERSKNYKNIWSPEMHVFCPKYSNGSLICPKDPAGLLSWQYYREGDALHYSWFVPHDPEGLMALYESPEKYDESLRSFLETHEIYHEKFGSPVPNPYYWAGNEHDLLAPWLFNVGPNCLNTQYWTRKLTYMHYSNTPHGIPGNEDYGSMSTWFMFASLGIYPQAGTSRFFIGAPRVASAKIALNHWNGQQKESFLEVITHNNSQENTYIEKLLVNGQEWTMPSIDRKVLTQVGGTTLEFFMSSTPYSALCPSATRK